MGEESNSGVKIRCKNIEASLQETVHSGSLRWNEHISNDNNLLINIRYKRI